jgi:hypothetical protein
MMYGEKWPDDENDLIDLLISWAQRTRFMGNVISPSDFCGMWDTASSKSSSKRSHM